MNTTTRFDRYFDTFSQMSMDDLLDHHSELYGLRWFADLDFEAEVQVFEELQALEAYIYINFDIDLSESGDYSDDDEGYTIEDVEDDEAAWHDDCGQWELDYEEGSDKDRARAEMDWFEFCEMHDLPF